MRMRIRRFGLFFPLKTVHVPLNNPARPFPHSWRFDTFLAWPGGGDDRLDDSLEGFGIWYLVLGVGCWVLGGGICYLVFTPSLYILICPSPCVFCVFTLSFVVAVKSITFHLPPSGLTCFPNPSLLKHPPSLMRPGQRDKRKRAGLCTE